ncbi:MAG: proton-conducting transporter membrane subunit [Planctomycetota bacterium]
MLATLPILVPLLASALCLALWGRVGAQKVVVLLGTLSMVINAVILLNAVLTEGLQVAMMGGWAAPYGIALVADPLGAVMVLLTAICGLAIAIFSLGGVNNARWAHGYAALMLAMLAAISGAFVSGDLFNIYVWFELMLLSSFVLLTLGGERAQLEGAIKYVTLNLLSSMVFLSGVGLVYASVGTLNLADLAIRFDQIEDPRRATALAAPLLIAFAIKAAAFPLFFWLPASYHTPPPAVSALFAGLLTKVGVYTLIRVTTLVFDQERVLIGDAIIIMAGLTMASGVLGAMSQNDIRRILSFHIVSQIGYMLMGLGIALHAMGDGDPEAIPEVAVLAMAGAVFYIVHHIVVKTNLFLIAGAIHAERGTDQLDKLGGMVKTHPYLAALFIFSALSLAGIPVLSGFWAKVVLVRAGLEAGTYGIVAVSLAVSLLTLFSMMKIWTKAFWGTPARENEPPAGHAPGTAARLGPIVGLASITLGVALAAPWIYDFAVHTAETLLDPSDYIAAVLPPAPEAAEASANPGGAP